MNKNITQCVMLTGAGARISQEVACLDQLMQHKGLVIKEENTMIAGFSSGSLNLMALNACFRDQNPLDWNGFYKEQILWKLTNKDVYTKRGGLKIPKLNTKPLRKTLNAFLNKMDVEWMGDLPFHSFVLTYSDKEFATKWANNFLPKNNRGLNASDLFMSSTSIPFVFGHQKIGNKKGTERNFPKGHFNDGGSVGQFKRFDEHIGEYVKANGKFERLDIISPMREKNAVEGAKSLGGIVHQGLGNFEANMLFKAFYKFLLDVQNWQKENGPVADEVTVNIPRLAKNFPMLDFDSEQEQYNVVMDWYNQNSDQVAVPLDEFIKEHAE